MSWFFTSVLVAFTLWFTPAFGADCIYPSNEVVNGVNLRARPSTTSARRGLFRPTERLPLISIRAGWYETRSPNGQTAFVSKRWTNIASCDANPAVAAAIHLPTLPAPLLATGHPVDWWFVFKLNAATFPRCEGSEHRTCPFGGAVQPYNVGQQFVTASSEDTNLKKGGGCLGTTLQDPVGATFDAVYTGQLHYVVWNDQFKGDPTVTGCGADCGSPWGHSKGMVAWNDSGVGFVLQVTTPSWPGAGNQEHPRQFDGNTLGCTIGNNVRFSQHFFALKTTKADLIKILEALRNASVGTDPANPQIVNTGGPVEIQNLVMQLGHRSNSTTATMVTLSSGVQLISKPSKLKVPPWQMVSSLLGGVPLRTATWWNAPKINSTTAATHIGCWDSALSPPGAVDIATSGQWDGTMIGLKAGANHAKIGVSTDANSQFSIFGDLNQQGVLAGNTCNSSQNGRGGLFFVIKNRELTKSVSDLIKGDTAPAD